LGRESLWLPRYHPGWCALAHPLCRQRTLAAAGNGGLPVRATTGQVAGPGQRIHPNGSGGNFRRFPPERAHSLGALSLAGSAGVLSSVSACRL